MHYLVQPGRQFLPVITMPMKICMRAGRRPGLALLLFVLGACCCRPAQATWRKTRVLVFCKTQGFHHSSIGAGIAALRRMGTAHHFTVDTTTDAALFRPGNLKQYAAVIFLNTTGDVLDEAQQQAFEQYIRAGGGYVGVHAAADCEYDWPWYGGLVGAWFKSHPRQQEARLKVHRDPKFPVTATLPDPWVRKDEWYNFRALPKDVHVLLEIDEKSYEGGENGAFHPMAWYHDYDGGRAFYVELGHTEASYEEVPYLNLLLSGIRYASGRRLR